MPRSAPRADPRAAAVVAVVGDPGPAGWDRLSAIEDASIVDVRSASPTLLATVDILFVWDFRWHSLETLVPRLPSLRWIHTASAGVDHVLIPAVARKGIVVTNSAGVFEQPIAEYVLGLVLAYAKGIVETVDAQRERRWSYRETRSIRDRVMVVVGLGRIGRAVAELARAAGMRLIGVRRSPGDEPDIDVVTIDRLPAVLPEADYVVVTAALTAETRGLIGAAALSAMKPSAYLINVARGPIVDVDALVAALRDRTIAGAALDVFDDEPLPPDSPLWTVPGLLISPHMSADADGWDRRVIETFEANLRRYAAAEPLLNVVDQARGY